jgi:3-methyladenine DNA glycosylase AlkD
VGFEIGIMQLKAVLIELKSMGDPKAAAGMARFGINADRALGISIPRLQGLAKNIGKNHKLAEEIQQNESKAARWVAHDALRELRSENVKKRLSGRAMP